jgi:hypothetical protein
VTKGPVRAAFDDLVRGEPDPGQPGREHRVAAQRPAGRVDPCALSQAQRPLEQEFLVGEGSVQFGGVHAAGLRGPGGGGGRRGGGQVAGAEYA